LTGNPAAFFVIK